MKLSIKHKFILVTALILIAAAGVLYITRQVLEISRQLQQDAVWIGSIAGILLLVVLGISWWLVRRKPVREVDTIDNQTVSEAIERAESLGVDMADVKSAIGDFEKRREKRIITVTIFGHVNTGKSTLIAAMTGDATPETTPIAGTTQQIVRYKWQDLGAYRVELVDVPGRAEHNGDERGKEAWEAGMASDLILYLTDSDLTREQLDDLDQLVKMKKPLILALNKTDLYTESELDEILGALRKKTEDFLEESRVVPLAASGRRKLILKKDDGSKEEVWQDLKPEFNVLSRQVADLLSEDAEALVALADTVFVGHMHGRVREMVEERRRVVAGGIVSSYSKGAVVAALAAVAPGLEVVLIGGVGVRMISELGNLYGSSLNMGRIEQLLKAATGQLKDVGKLSMIIGGNILKAFPGIGTVAGGILHALVYGFVVRGIGLSVIDAMEKREEISEKAFLKRLDGYMKELPPKEEIKDLLSVARALTGKESDDDKRR